MGRAPERTDNTVGGGVGESPAFSSPTSDGDTLEERTEGYGGYVCTTVHMNTCVHEYIHIHT